MNVLDLFSGVGGFSLGLNRAGMKTVAFCEIDPFCRKVLKKHWPDVPVYEDVQTMDFKEIKADVITAGFPCQDISFAGPGAGLSGERSGLYREAVRAVRVVRPKYVIMENVAALLNRGMGQVCGDLAESGYDSEWDCIPACAVGAEHERDRVWIVAYPTEENASNSNGSRFSRRPQTGKNKKKTRDIFPRLRSAVPTEDGISRDYWAHQPVLGRGVHGVSNRVDRIKALGNSVVPQIPEMIGRAIMDAENDH